MYYKVLILKKDFYQGLLRMAILMVEINQWVIVVNVFRRITSGVLLLSPRGAWTEWGNRTTKGVIVTVTG